MINNECELLLVRHARTAWNALRWTQGHTDVPLDDHGWRMAEALLHNKALADVQVIYSSDLRRAWQTAEPLAKHLGLEIRLDARLREGRWGTPHPTDEYDILPFPVTQETKEQMGERARACMMEIVAKHPGRKVVVMTHGGPIRQMLGAALGAEVVDAAKPAGKTANTAICHLRYADGQWSAVRLFDCDHLIAAGLSTVVQDAG